MIKNIIFDFDGVVVDSEILAARSFCKYLKNLGIHLEEKDFAKYAGKKTIQIVSELCSIYNISDKNLFFNEVLSIAEDLFIKELKEVRGVKYFLNKINQKKFIGSNSTKNRIIEGLKITKLDNFFSEKIISSFDNVKNPKPFPDIYLKLIKDNDLSKEETIIIEDSVVGICAAVNAGIKVVGLTAGSHWHKNRSNKELFEAGAYEVINDYEEMLLLLNKL